MTGALPLQASQQLEVRAFLLIFGTGQDPERHARV
jgi:hypothetical protein